MNKKNIILTIKNKPDLELIPKNIQDNINKIFNIEKTAQFDLMKLEESDCQDILNTLDFIQEQIKQNSKHHKNIRNLKAEYIPIVTSNDVFI